MALVILLAVSLSTFNAQAAEVDCEVHQIYCHIVKNKPSINKAYAMKLSNIIYKKALKYDLDPKLYSAIIAQESSYSLTAKNCTRGIDTKTKKESVVCSDFGISQIHYNTVKRFDFQIEKLTLDLDYSVEAGMKVLKGFKKRYSKKEPTWWL